jgi:hypothetical protein
MHLTTGEDYYQGDHSSEPKLVLARLRMNCLAKRRNHHPSDVEEYCQVLFPFIFDNL